MKRFFSFLLGIVSLGSHGLFANYNCCPNPCPCVYNNCCVEDCCPSVCWTGIYAGLNGGWGWSRASVQTTPIGGDSRDDLIPLSYTAKLDGALFGGQAGFNWQMRRIVLGVEGDVDGCSFNGEKTEFSLSGIALPDVNSVNLSSIYVDIDWAATIRGRVGATWGKGLLFVTGGAAWAHLKMHINNTAQVGINAFGEVASSNLSKTKAGWVAGLGYERMIASRWSLRAEYLHYHFGKGPNTTLFFTFPFTAGDALGLSFGRTNIDAIRVGVNYIFSWPRI